MRKASLNPSQFGLLDVAAERWFQAHPWRVGALLALAAVAVNVALSRAGVNATTAAASVLVVGVIATLAGEFRMPKAWEWMFGVALAASTFVVLFVLTKWRHDRSGNQA